MGKYSEIMTDIKLIIRISIILLLSTLISSCEPQDRTPGAWLSGEIVNERISDWRFSDAYQEVFLETHPWYGIPFSVTVVAASTGKQIYVPSIYIEAATFPGTKYWNKIIQSNPVVNLKMGGKLYPRKARLVTQTDEYAAALDAFAAKYPFWQELKTTNKNQLHFVLIALDDV